MGHHDGTMAFQISRQRKGPDERRGKTRLAIGRDVRYKLLGNKKRAMEIGEGKILNISSGGVLFTAQTALPVGERVELVVSWPALLDGSLPLNLFIRAAWSVARKRKQPSRSRSTNSKRVVRPPANFDLSYRQQAGRLKGF